MNMIKSRSEMGRASSNITEVDMKLNAEVRSVSSHGEPQTFTTKTFPNKPTAAKIYIKVHTMLKRQPQLQY